MNQNKTIVGLTGQSGAGKSTVARIFKQHGFFVIDADSVARKITSNEDVVKMLADNFGKNILNGKELNRKALASIVFSDREQLNHLNQLLFPIICKEIVELINGCRQKYVLLDAPQLFESELNKICNKVIAAISPREILIWRITSRDNISKEDAENRLNSQFSQEFFVANADYVVDTYNQLESSETQAERIINEIIPHIDVFEF